MKLADQREIHAPREAVWAGITDPDTLKRCISGCQEMTGSVEEGFDAVVVQKVGPVKATFRGHVDILDVVEGEAATLRGEGKGGPAGFAKGEARVTLTEIPDGTRLDYEVEAKVGGKLAQLGGRVIDGVAGRMSDGFFDRFKEVVEEPGGATGAEARAARRPGRAPAPRDGRRQRRARGRLDRRGGRADRARARRRRAGRGRADRRGAERGRARQVSAHGGRAREEGLAEAPGLARQARPGLNSDHGAAGAPSSTHPGEGPP